MTSIMPTYAPYTDYTCALNRCHNNSIVPHSHNLVCAQRPEAHTSSISIHSNQGGSRTSFNQYDFPITLASRPEIRGSSETPPRLIFAQLFHARSLYASIPLPPLSHFEASMHPLLEIGTTPRIDYDVYMHPSTARSRHGLAGDDRWHYEPAVNPNLGSLTIRSALVGRPIVVFPASLDHGVVAVYDVFLAIYFAVYTSALEIHSGLDQHHEARWTSSPPHGYGGYRLNLVEARNAAPAGSYRWVGLTPSPTERDVWILVTA